MKKIKSILGGFVDLLMLVVIVFATGITLISLTSDDKNVSKIGKYMPFNVKSDSMEPAIMKGDFIISEVVDNDDLKVGDVISFFAVEKDYVLVKTHRIVAIDDSGIGRSFITRSDKNAVNDDVPVFENDIVGVWNGTRLPKVGLILDFVSSQVGFLICIVLPLLILFIYQIYRFIIVVIEEKNSATIKNNEAILAAAERIRAAEEAMKNKEIEEI